MSIKYKLSDLVVQRSHMLMLLRTLLARLLARALVVVRVDSQASNVRHVLELHQAKGSIQSV